MVQVEINIGQNKLTFEAWITVSNDLDINKVSEMIDIPLLVDEYFGGIPAYNAFYINESDVQNNPFLKYPNYNMTHVVPVTFKTYQDGDGDETVYKFNLHLERIQNITGGNPQVSYKIKTERATSRKYISYPKTKDKWYIDEHRNQFKYADTNRKIIAMRARSG